MALSKNNTGASASHSQVSHNAQVAGQDTGVGIRLSALYPKVYVGIFLCFQLQICGSFASLTSLPISDRICFKSFVGFIYILYTN
jgi:hypothetical protein